MGGFWSPFLDFGAPSPIFRHASVSSTYPGKTGITVVLRRITVVLRRITVVLLRITVVLWRITVVLLSVTLSDFHSVSVSGRPT